MDETRDGDSQITLTKIKPLVVCTENLNPDVVVMKSAKDGV